MTVGVILPVAETDPITVALSDPAVHARLLAAARAFLTSRVFNLSPGQRGQEAEEIVQKARLRAWEHRTGYDPPRDVVPWLVAFVRNVTREHVKKYLRSATGPPSGLPELEDLAADLGRPVSDIVADRALVEGLLGQLPLIDRQIIGLAYYEDLTFAEIGPRVGLTENAARVRHHRILSRLREIGGRTEEVRS